MARGFGNVTQFQNYSPLPRVAAISLAGISGQSAPLFINWANFPTNPNIGVLVDLSDASIIKSLTAIRSVYIDNMGSSAAIYIQFPDTGYTIVAQANSTVWVPVYTNQYKFTVFALGIDPTSIPLTKVLVTNIPAPPANDIELATAIELWKASPVLARTGALNPALGNPALGDQFAAQTISLQVNGQVLPLFGGPYPVGNFIYVTSAYFTVIGYQSSGGAASQNRLFFESTGTAGIIFEQDVAAPAAQFIPFIPILTINGQWKLDASQTYRLRNLLILGAPTGAWNASFSYTVAGS